MTHTKLADKELVLLMRAKSRASAEVLYDQYNKILFLTIIRIVPQREKAEDLLEQTYIKIWNTFNLYRAENGTVLCWMIKIARNLAWEVQQNIALGTVDEHPLTFMPTGLFFKPVKE